MTQIISRDTPLAEITLRKYEKPLGLERRELVRKLCLSTGILQPGDSRDVIVDIFYVLLEARKNREELSSDDVRDRVLAVRHAARLSQNGAAPSNIRRQLKRLRELFLIQKIRNRYRINEHENLSRIFEERVEQYLLTSVIGRVKEYVTKVDEMF